jgi:hypothetical protein
MTDMTSEFMREMDANGWVNEIIRGLFILTGYFASKYLEAMGEPSLSSMAEQDEVYRFLYMPAFHHPITIRVWRSGEEKNLVFKELDYIENDLPGKVIAQENRRITADEWNEFTNLLQEASYWQLPIEGELTGVDGARWILEGKKDEQYHVVDRWSPAPMYDELMPEGGSYREVCLYLMKLSGRIPQDIY